MNLNHHSRNLMKSYLNVELWIKDCGIVNRFLKSRARINAQVLHSCTQHTFACVCELLRTFYYHSTSTGVNDTLLFLEENVLFLLEGSLTIAHRHWKLQSWRIFNHCYYLYYERNICTKPLIVIRWHYSNARIFYTNYRKKYLDKIFVYWYSNVRICYAKTAKFLVTDTILNA